MGVSSRHFTLARHYPAAYAARLAKESFLAADQAQADGQRFAEHLVVFLAFQLGDFLDHAGPVRWHRLRPQDREDAAAMAVVDVEGPLTTAACELGQAERPGHAFAVVA